MRVDKAKNATNKAATAAKGAAKATGEKIKHVGESNKKEEGDKPSISPKILAVPGGGLRLFGPSPGETGNERDSQYVG